MRRLYLVIPGPERTEPLVRELLADGLKAEDIRLFSRRPERLDNTPVTVKGLGATKVRLLSQAAFGALAAVLVLILVSILAAALGGAALASPVVVVLVAAGGAFVGAATTWAQPYPTELRPLRDELRRDDVVMRIEVPDERLLALETEIKDRHPELRIKGTDPAGSPPFP